MDALDVALLVEAAAIGDQDAWNALVERFASTVWAIARGYRLNSADAADVFQTTWLRLLEHLDRIEQPERVGAWLGTTARRECLRVLRITGRQVPSGQDFDVLPDPAPSQSPDRDIIARERSRIVNRLVERLPMRSQLLLRFLSAEYPAELPRHKRDALDADRQYRSHQGSRLGATTPAGDRLWRQPGGRLLLLNRRVEPSIRAAYFRGRRPS